jgi:hypothetical protein
MSLTAQEFTELVNLPDSIALFWEYYSRNGGTLQRREFYGIFPRYLMYLGDEIMLIRSIAYNLGFTLYLLQIGNQIIHIYAIKEEYRLC